MRKFGKKKTGIYENIYLFRDPNGKPCVFNKVQEALYKDKTRNKVIVLHRRAGKTSYAVAKCLESITMNENHRYWYVAPTYRQAKTIAWDMLKFMVRQFPPGMFKVREDELSVECMNTFSRFELKGSDNPDSLRGAGLHGLVLDEFQDQASEVYSLITRPMLATTGGWCDMIGTPKGKNHFYDYWRRAGGGEAGGGTGRLVTWKSWRVKASESGLLTPEELAQIKLELTEDEYNQEFECDFLSYAGLIFKEFGSHNIINPFRIPDSWERGYCLDHGATNPTAFYPIRIDTEGNVFVTDEYYEPRRIVSAHAECIKPMMGDDYTDPIIADPSIFNKTLQSARSQEAYSIADEYADYGLINMEAGQNDVMAGINRVNEYMSFDPEHIHPILGKKGSPRMFLFKGKCPKLEWEIANYQWKKRTQVNQNEPDQPLKMHDHGCDAIRYFIMSRPAVASQLGRPVEMNTVSNVLTRHIQKMKKVNHFGSDVPKSALDAVEVEPSREEELIEELEEEFDFS